MLSKKWYIKFPGDAYAMGPIEFEQPVDEAAVRKYARKWSGLARLPKSFECWPTKG